MSDTSLPSEGFQGIIHSAYGQGFQPQPIHFCIDCHPANPLAAYSNGRGRTQPVRVLYLKTFIVQGNRKRLRFGGMIASLGN